MEYRYSLNSKPPFKKLTCPFCNTKRSWVRYVDNLTGAALPDKYGRCDREINCGHYLNPYKEGYAKEKYKEENYYLSQSSKPMVKQVRKKHTAFVPHKILNSTQQLEGYKENRFVQYLLKKAPFPFVQSDIDRVVKQYQIGTITYNRVVGATTFPFIDADNNIRAIQVKQFDDKNSTKHTNFIHSILAKRCQNMNNSVPEWLTEYLKNERLITCLFGEHLLKAYPTNPIGLVEAPKTAIYATLYFGFPENKDNILWLSTFNNKGLTVEKCRALKNRNVFLFPDLSKNGKTFDEWEAVGKKIKDELQIPIKISTLLEKLASNEAQMDGADMADYLIQLDWRACR